MRCHFKLVWDAVLWILKYQKRQLNDPYVICRLSFSRSVVELQSLIRSSALPSWARGRKKKSIVSFLSSVVVSLSITVALLHQVSCLKVFTTTLQCDFFCFLCPPGTQKMSFVRVLFDQFLIVWSALVVPVIYLPSCISSNSSELITKRKNRGPF